MIATCSSPPAAASACTARRSTSRPSWQAKPSESKRSTTAFGSSASCTTIWDISTSNRGPCSPSTTPSARGCHPCLRYNLSPMSPGWTVCCWSGRWESNPRHTAWEAVVLPLNYARLSLEHSRATALAARAGRSRTAYAPRGHGGSSSLHARGPAGEHGLHPRPVDVVAGDDDAHTPARRMAAFLHQRRQGRGAGAFGERMRIAEQDADRLGDLRVRDFDDALGSPSNDLERRRIGRAHRNPVREGERGIRRYDAARFEREPVGVGALGDDADDPRRKPERVAHADEAADPGAEPDRNIDRVEIGVCREQLVGVGRDADDEIAVERGPELEPARLRKLDRARLGLVEIPAVLDQLGPERAHGGVLLGGIAARHHDRDRHVRLRAGKR